MSELQRDLDLRTRYLARLLGTFFLLFTIAVYLHPDYAALLADKGTLLIMGIGWLVAGTAIVLGHNRWRGGALAVAVTLIAWSMALRGAAILLASPDSAVAVLNEAGFARHARLYFIIDLAIGLYFALAGFFARTVQPD